MEPDVGSESLNPNPGGGAFPVSDQNASGDCRSGDCGSNDSVAYWVGVKTHLIKGYQQNGLM